MSNPIELQATREGERTLLCCPEVGIFTEARTTGQLLSGGEGAGTLLCLGTAHPLTVPPGVSGRIANEQPERVHQPVGYGEVLYELEPIGDAPGGEVTVKEGSAAVAAGLLLPAPHAGRFWHCPAPGEPPFCRAGDELTEGAAVGLIEIMKTFTQIPYIHAGSLPPRARVLRLLVEDGADVERGDALLEVEPVSS